MEVVCKIIHVILCFYLTILTISTEELCDKTKCPGPLAYYLDIGCTPVYENKGDCCAYKYNCDHLKNRLIDKCYINGNVYEIGESLKDEDAAPCDISCKCLSGYSGVAQFSCAEVDCFQGPVKPGCYRKNSPLSCCPEEEVCPENPEDRATCVVDGKVYKDGEYFSIASEPKKSCTCQPGYTGENIEPFCTDKNMGCRPELRSASDIHHKCVPVYYSSQSPQTSCSVFSRCQNANDRLIDNSTDGDTETDDVTCEFGNFTMHQGDELNQASDYSSVCVKCICEVGPVPTCQRLPDEECDVTKHPPFHF